MTIKKYTHAHILFLITLSLCFTQVSNNNFPSQGQQDYYTDENGNVFIYVNILGHVQKPGTYLVYEGADIMTILAQAGGPSQGAKLNSISIYHKNSSKTTFNLDKYLNDNNDQSALVIKPNDTIYIKQSMGSYLFANSNFINSVLQLINISLVISNID